MISRNAWILTGLTRLTLHASLKANSSIIQVLRALQRMPALNHLCLGEGSIPDDSKGPFTYAVVNLPCLRVLNISSDIGAVTAVLRHITFPHSAILNLTCKEIQFTQIDFSSFFSVLATKFLSTIVIRSLSLRVSDDGQTHVLKFCLWTTALIQDCFPLSEFSQSQLQLVLIWPSLQLYNHMRALTWAFDAMNLPFLTQLQMSLWIVLILNHGSRLLESFLSWNGCVCRALHHTRSLRHWFIKRRQKKNRKQLATTSPFLNFAISIWKALISLHQIR